MWGGGGTKGFIFLEMDIPESRNKRCRVPVGEGAWLIHETKRNSPICLRGEGKESG